MIEKAVHADWLWPPLLLDKLQGIAESYFVAGVKKVMIPIDFYSQYKLSKPKDITPSFAHLLLK